MQINNTAVQAALQIDLDEAERFLNQLAHDTEEFTFQTFDDEKANKNPNLTKILHGTLQQHVAELTCLNKQGAGIFVTINKTDLLGRKVGNVKDVRKLFVDTDGAPLEPIHAACKSGGIKPSSIVETSPGNCHVYWDANCGLDDFKPIQEALANKFGTDKNVKDLPRVMRLPGFYHQKRKNGEYINKCGPFLVSTLRMWDKPTAYTPQQMIQGLGLEITKPAPARIAANDATTAALQTSPPPETQEQIARVKSMLAAIPADCDRATWRNIIWAVAATGWSCAERLAREWSMTARALYVGSDFDRDWKSFSSAGGIGLGTLVYYANQYGYSDPTATSSQTCDWVDAINQRYAWIEENASIYRLDYADFIEPGKFRTQLDNRSVSVQSGGNTKPVGVGSAWIKHPIRRQHRQLVMRPEEGLITGDNCLNEWRGFAVKHVPGDVAVYLKLLEHLVPDQNTRHYILTWVAHLLQHPEIKMYVALAFWSLQQGVGKNLLFECISSIIGPTHATIIGQAELAASFNGWANRKVLVIGDEVSGSDRRPEADKLKGLVTGTTLYLNEKYQPAREVPNLTNFIFLSNHHDALFLDDHDRRFLVWEITADRLPDAMATEFVEWRDNGGLPALLNFLLAYDISDFNPKAPAPMTEAKQQMVADSRSDLESWLADVVASGAAAVIGREIATAHEIATYYKRDTSNNQPSAKTIAGAAKRAGAYSRANQVRLSGGRKVRVLAIERPDYWKQQPEAEWANEMKKPLKL